MLYQKDVLLFVDDFFIGKYLTQRLTEVGYQVHLVGKYNHLHDLSPYGYVGQLNLIPSSSLSTKDVKSLIKSKYAVVNCLQRMALEGCNLEANLWPTVLAKYCDTHVNLVHIESIFCSKKSSDHVINNCSSATALNMDFVFGYQEKFINALNFMAHLLRKVILPKYSSETCLCPIYAQDVAIILESILSDPKCHHGKSYLLKGRERYSLTSMGQLIAKKYSLSDKSIIGVPHFIIRCLKILPRWILQLVRENDSGDASDAYSVPNITHSLTPFQDYIENSKIGNYRNDRFPTDLYYPNKNHNK